MTFDRAEHRTRPVCLGTPLATCTLPVGANYLLTYLLSGLWTIWELNEVLDSTRGTARPRCSPYEGNPPPQVVTFSRAFPIETRRARMKENMYAENFVLPTRYRYAREDACALISRLLM
jgi:hypothetical protein